jgi:membrane-associated phospholipid phosphatase
MKRAAAVLSIALLTPTPLTASAEPQMPTPIDGLGEDIADAFWGYELLYYAGAVGETGVMAFSGGDHAVRVEFVRYLQAQAWGDASFVAGYAVPATTAPTIWVVGLVTHDPVVAGAGSAAIQALAVTLATTGLLKLGTGRPYPLHGGDPHAQDRLDHPEYAREFRPFQNGLGAWPSGHTSSTISIAAALTAYAPDQPWIPAIGYPLGAAIGLGMIDRDSHWTSDVVAGALVGHAIGWSIGRNFRGRVRGELPRQTSLEVVPLPGARGLALSGQW